MENLTSDNNNLKTSPRSIDDLSFDSKSIFSAENSNYKYDKATFFSQLWILIQKNMRITLMKPSFVLAHVIGVAFVFLTCFGFDCIVEWRNSLD